MKNEITVYYSKSLHQWVIETDQSLSSVGTYKQAQKVARKALWAMNADREMGARYKGTINYARKSDRTITVTEYVGFDKKGWAIIKTARVNYGRVA